MTDLPTGRTERAAAAPPSAGSGILPWVHRHAAAAIVLAGVAIRLVSWGVGVARATPMQLAGRTPDDAYYFLVIARNLAAGDGPTFDGVEATTGYQPLWQGLLAAFALVVPDAQQLRVALVLGGLLALAGFVAMARATHAVVALTPFGFALGLAVASGPLAWDRTVNGMEGAAVVAAMGLVALAAHRWWQTPTMTAMGLVGAAGGLLCLGRTSQVVTIAIVPLLLLWGVVRSGRQVSLLRQLAAWAVGAAFVWLPWFLWSWATVGTTSSSAGAVKAYWQERTTGGFPSRAGLDQTAAAAATELWRQVSGVAPFTYDWPGVARRLIELVIVAVVVWGVVRVLRRASMAVVVVAPALAVVTRYGVELLWIPNMRASWYTAPLFTLTGLGVAVATSWLVRRSASSAAALRARTLPRPARIGAQVVFGLAVVALVGQQAATIPPTWGEANWEAAQELRSYPPSTRIGSFDTGSLGYVRPGVVNLDGLVRGPDYVEEVTSGRPLAEVVVDEDLDLLVGRLVPGDARLPDCAVPEWRSSQEVLLDGRREPVRIWSLGSCPSG
ncbi:hypothetical protein ACE2AJ_07380 [Aquihabitans daechungensis]|uniref:hypothetical protein n=1 Tax=Aquihabitans daechungensis TaxID=1052257 RepID=UPI003B9FD164